VAQRSSIQQLPPAVKEAVDAAVREGRATIDDIVALIRGHGVDASCSAVGRYKASMEESLKSYREAQQVAGVWASQLTENPQGDVGRLVQEMLKSLAFNTLANMGRGGEEIGPEDIMLLAKAFKDLESAQKTNVEFKVKVKAELRAEQAEKLKVAEAEIARVQKGGGLAATDAAALRRALLDAMA